MNVVGLVLSDDLLFASQITGYAHDLGLKVRIVRDAVQLANLVAEHRPKCVWMDLQVAGPDISTIVSKLRIVDQDLLLIGFGSHVDHVSLENARQAGCDHVLPRSALSARLPNEIKNWLSGTGETTSPS